MSHGRGDTPSPSLSHFCCDQGEVGLGGGTTSSLAALEWWVRGMPEGTLRGLGGDGSSVPSAGSRAPRCGAGRPPGSHPRGGGGRHRCRGTGRSWTSVSGTPPRWGWRGQRGTRSSLHTASPSPNGVGCWWGCGTMGTGQVLVAPWDPAALSPGPDPANLGLGPTRSHPASLSSATASESDPLPTRPRATPSLRKSPGSPPGAVTFRGQYTGGCQQRLVLETEGGHPHVGVPGHAHAGFWQGHGTRRGCRAPPRHPEKSQAPQGVPGAAGAGRRRVSGPGSSPQPLLAFPNAR